GARAASVLAVPAIVAAIPGRVPPFIHLQLDCYSVPSIFSCYVRSFLAPTRFSDDLLGRVTDSLHRPARAFFRRFLPVFRLPAARKAPVGRPTTEALVGSTRIDPRDDGRG